MIMSSAYGGGEEEACQPITLLGDSVKAFKTCTNFDVQHVLARTAIMFHNFITFGCAFGYISHFFFPVDLSVKEVSSKRAIMFHCIVEIKSPCPLQQQQQQ